MIPFKNHKPGVSFLEVMVALMLVSLVMIASFKTQGTLLRSTAAAVNKLQATAALKNYFMQAQQEEYIDEDGTQEEELDFPVMKLTYHATRAKDASVFKNVPDLMIEKVTARWHEFNQEQTMTMVRFTHHKKTTEATKAPA